MRSVNYVLVIVAFLVYFATFGREGMDAAWLFLPFTMLPYLVNASLAKLWLAFESQALVAVATVAYSGWFVYVYMSATVWHPDAQSPLAFLFVGIYAVPVLSIFWWTSYALEWKYRKQS